MKREALLPSLAFGGAFFIPLLVYFPHLAASPQNSDGAEFVLVGALGTLAHPPGYPLYSNLVQWLSHVWSGNAYLILSGFSAVCQSLAVLVLYLISQRLLAKPLLSLSLSLSWALYFPTILSATDSEVFALHNLISLTLVWICVWLIQFEKSPSLFLLLGLCFGLGISHQHMIVLWSPLFVATIWAAQGKSAQVLFWAGLGCIIGVLPYTTLPLRYAADPNLAFGPMQGIADFIVYFFRLGYGTFSLSLADESHSISYLGHFATSLARELPVFILLAFLFLFFYFSDRRSKANFPSNYLNCGVLLSLGLHLCLAWAMRLPPDYAAYGDWIARFYSSLALGVVVAGVLCLPHFGRRRLLDGLIILGLLIPALTYLPGTFEKLSLHQRAAVQREIDSVLHQALPRAIVLTESDRLGFGLAYEIHALERRKDLTLVMVGRLGSPHYRKVLVRQLPLWHSINPDDPKFFEKLLATAFKSGYQIVAEPQIIPPPGIDRHLGEIFFEWTQKE